VIALRGDLGAGKTTLARAIARGAGVEGPIPSPTYNLLFRYDEATGGRLVHIDLYRIEDQSEVWELGWQELPAEDELVLIEWPERAEELLPAPRWEISLLDEGDPMSRSVRIRRVGDAPPIPLPRRLG
jgi:tRNA threonylcarbamoyl adenosine modification protein YjeE